MNLKNNKNCFDDSESESGQVRYTVSFESVLELVKDQADFDCFCESEKAQAEEVCLIIAEIHILPPSAPVKIAGVQLTAGAVAQIYNRLTHEHVRLVLDKFNSIAYRINFKKSYLRTALYNSVFELESDSVNEFKATFKG